MLSGHLYNVDKTRGFDCNDALTFEEAKAMQQAGYQFCFRYLKRVESSTHVTTREAQDILNAGLALGLVQHVAPPAWVPDKELGLRYGETTVNELVNLGYPPGGMGWLDLEGVRASVPQWDVIEYCNAWHSQLAGAGYLPGIYLGDSPGITGKSAYQDLRFTHYWAAYNLNKDLYPIVRGVQLRQRSMRGYPQPVPRLEFDVDESQIDGLGGTAIFLSGQAGVE